MVAVLLLQLIGHRSGPAKGTGWIVASVLTSFAAAAVQAEQIRVYKDFNHNDLYHVIQLGAVYFFYRGGLLLEDRTGLFGSAGNSR